VHVVRSQCPIEILVPYIAFACTESLLADRRSDRQKLTKTFVGLSLLVHGTTGLVSPYSLHHVYEDSTPTGEMHLRVIGYFNFYGAKRSGARYCHLPRQVVCLSVCPSVTLRYRVHRLELLENNFSAD